MNNPHSIEMGTYPFMAEATLDEIEESVETSYGKVKVSIYGQKGRHPIVTFHDIGMNSVMNFENFFQFQTPMQLAKRFYVYNINAPGQEIGASNLASSCIYPSMDGLARIVEEVIKHFGIKTFIGFGIGAGANVLLRYALNHPNKLDALLMINPTSQKAGWIEWFYQKWNLSYLRQGMTKQFTVDYLMWHHFGKHLEECHPDIVQQYRAYFATLKNPKNLAPFIESYLNRNEIILRDAKCTTEFLLDVPSLIIVGSKSGHIEESVYVNSQLNPKHTEWLKVSDSCGLVLDDRPEEIVQAFVLFLQGLGFCADMNIPRIMRGLRGGEMQEMGQPKLKICEDIDEINNHSK